jgi:hypothetical protein
VSGTRYLVLFADGHEIALVLAGLLLVLVGVASIELVAAEVDSELLIVLKAS